MKKYLLTLALLLICHISFAQNPENIFAEFSQEPNAEYVSISPFLMSIGKMFMGNDSDAKLAKKFKSMKVLELGSCSESVKERFCDKVKALQIGGYETLMQVNDDGEKVHILMKAQKDVIRELLIVCTDKDDCSFIQMNGKVKKDKIAKMLNNMKKKNGRH